MNTQDTEFETVVLWRGQYRNDGIERLKILEERAQAFPHLHNLRLRGESGDWAVVCEARKVEAS